MRTQFVLILALVYSIAFGQTGRVGINTETPLATLHVKDSSVLFTGGMSVAAPYTAPPVEGPGVRMMWYPSKGAFRAGSVNGSAWNKDSIGVQSVALGFNTKALRPYTIALGESSVARGDNSISIGRLTNAEGFGSVAIGIEAQALSPGAVSFGTSAAIGFNAISIGSGNTAFGDYATALGSSNNAFGESSCTLGYYGTVVGNYGLTAGFETTVEGNYGVAFGEGTYAAPSHAFVVGRYNVFPESYTVDDWIDSDELFIVGNGSSGNPSNAMTVLKNGNVSLGGINPVAKLEVEGNFRLGEEGSVLQSIVKHTENIDIGSISSMSSQSVFAPVNGAQSGGAVSVSPGQSLPNGLIISYARVVSHGLVEIGLWNASPVSVDPVVMDFYITVTQ